MKIRILALLLLLFAPAMSSSAQSTSEINFYEVILLRAAPGQLPELIERAKVYKQELSGKLIIMRHSQGDHWDLMLMSPSSEQLPRQIDFNTWVDFQHNFIATAPVTWESLVNESEGANLFHIEMFQAARGAYEKLLEQRVMENNYLVATERKANHIFLTRFGSDVDIFTLGIYKDLQAFAAEPDLPERVFEKAATDAGFTARSDIGFYLREFLVGHQDTLATQVK